MNKMQKALYELSEMDELAARQSPIHSLHPAAKLITTIVYILVTLSFDKYDLSGLVPMVLWPVIMFQISGVNVRTCFYKLRIVLPLVMAVGLFNPIFDREIMLTIGNIGISGGVISMLTLMLKGVFCLMMSFLLVATTPFALRGSPEAACTGDAGVAASADIPLRGCNDRRAGSHDRCLLSESAGAEGHTHLCLGIFPGPAASEKHGPRAGAFFKHDAARLPRAFPLCGHQTVQHQGRAVHGGLHRFLLPAEIRGFSTAHWRAGCEVKL